LLFERVLNAEPRPDIILVTSGMTYWYPAYQDIIRLLKEHFPSTPVILGGVYPSLCPEHARHHGGADAVFEGDSIPEMIALINALTGERLGYIDGSERVIPAYDLYPELGYVTLRTSKGCPFRCTYCGWYLIDKCFTRQEPEFVIDEIEYFYSTLNIRNFSFYDDALLLDAEHHIVKILEGLISRKIKAAFHTPNGLHNVFMTKELAGLFKTAGFVTPRLALETSSPERQAATGLKTTNEDFLNALSCLRDAGYKACEIGANILIGLPEVSAGEEETSIRFAARHGVRIFLEEYSPIPGTPDYKKSGLAEDADPLLHNNTVFVLRDPDRCRHSKKMKDLVRSLNTGRPLTSSPQNRR
jgi:radical SAM superfamily enzyme YgiQ (UPF0313 family)